jgi:hypothetical protein
MMDKFYNTQLQAGLGMIEETRTLLNLWSPGMDSMQLQKAALESGQLPNISARRLHNIVSECFNPRFLQGNPPPAQHIKALQNQLSSKEFEQLLFLYTCRANLMLFDFVRDVYWNVYSSGRDILTNEEAATFVVRANQDGKTRIPWSENTIRRNSGYLTGCCADFGLLEKGTKRIRKILPFRIEPRISIFLAHELHFLGKGDNSVLSDPVWALFGIERSDVLNEFKRLALKGWFIIQSAGEITRIGWKYQTMEELTHALITG